MSFNVLFLRHSSGSILDYLKYRRTLLAFINLQPQCLDGRHGKSLHCPLIADTVVSTRLARHCTRKITLTRQFSHNISLNDEYDVVIAGGGVMGCSTAYHLATTDNKLKIAVVERDPSVG